MGMASIVLDEKPEEKELKSFVGNNTGRTGRAGIQMPLKWLQLTPK